MLRAYYSLACKEEIATLALCAFDGFLAMKVHAEAIAVAIALQRFIGDFVVVANDVFIHPFTTAIFGKVMAILGGGGGVFRVVFVQDFFDKGVALCQSRQGWRRQG